MIKKTLITVLLLPIIGCSGSGGGGGGKGGADILGNSGFSLGNVGSMIPGGRGGQVQQYADATSSAISYLTLSQRDEDELGQTVAIAATNQWPLFDKPDLTKYVTMVGLTVASVTPNPDGNWVFGVLDTPDLGAYSGPNGYIMVTRGAIAAMQDESELAGVLAHEIAHVLNHDGYNVVKSAKFNQALIQGASAANRQFAQFSQGASFLTDTVLRSGWNQDQEHAADAKGVQYLADAGYDPNGLTRFLKRLEQRKGGSAKLFSTHPGTADRIARITAQVGSGKTGATNKERFVKAAAEAKL